MRVRALERHRNLEHTAAAIAVFGRGKGGKGPKGGRGRKLGATDF